MVALCSATYTTLNNPFDQVFISTKT